MRFVVYRYFSKKNISVNTITVSNSLHQQTSKIVWQRVGEGCAEYCVLVDNFLGIFHIKIVWIGVVIFDLDYDVEILICYVMLLTSY